MHGKGLFAGCNNNETRRSQHARPMLSHLILCYNGHR